MLRIRSDVADWNLPWSGRLTQIINIQRASRSLASFSFGMESHWYHFYLYLIVGVGNDVGVVACARVGVVVVVDVGVFDCAGVGVGVVWSIVVAVCVAAVGDGIGVVACAVVGVVACAGVDVGVVWGIVVVVGVIACADVVVVVLIMWLFFRYLGHPTISNTERPTRSGKSTRNSRERRDC